MMGGWDDFMMDHPLAAWSALLGGILLVGGGLGAIAELAGIAAFGIVVSVLIVGMFIAITR